VGDLREEGKDITGARGLTCMQSIRKKSIATVTRVVSNLADLVVENKKKRSDLWGEGKRALRSWACSEKEISEE